MADVDPGTCPSCGRPRAGSLESVGNPDFCWKTDEYCTQYERDTKPFRDRIRAIESELAASNAKVRQFMACADALEDLAEERDPVRCLSAKGLEFTYECPIDAPCLACRVRRRIEKAESELAELRKRADSWERMCRRVAEMGGVDVRICATPETSFPNPEPEHRDDGKSG